MKTQEKEEWMVNVRCMTYNHASYIVDAMNGFTMQETTFPFVCCIVDDASTDGEQEVIKNYLNEHFDLGDKKLVRQEETDDYVLIFARHKVNLNCYFAVFYLKYNHYSIKKSKVSYLSRWSDNAKYEATCEGDDYWINPNKLKAQIDALEKHPDCSIAYNRVQVVACDGKYIENRTIPYGNDIEQGIVTLKDYCMEEFGRGHWCFHTSSFVYKKEMLNHTSERELFFSKFPYGDMPTQLWALLHGNGYYEDIVGGCYRTSSGGYNTYVKEHPNFAIAQESKLIEALSYFDTLTKRKYHKYVQRKILKSNFKIERLKGGRNSFLKPKYWTKLRFLSTKEIVALFIKVIFPNYFQASNGDGK